MPKQASVTTTRYFDLTFGCKRTIVQGFHLDWKTWENGKAFSSHSSRMRTVPSLLYRRVLCPRESPYKGVSVRETPPVDRQTPVKILPCYKTSFAGGKNYGKSQGILSVRKSGNHVVISSTDERHLRGELPEHDPARPGDRLHGWQWVGGARAPRRPLHPGRDGPRIQLLPEAQASQQSHPQVCRSRHLNTHHEVCRASDLNRVILRYVGPGTSTESSWGM